jgi:uncharacterized Zn finger protein
MAVPKKQRSWWTSRWLQPLVQREQRRDVIKSYRIEELHAAPGRISAKVGVPGSSRPELIHVNYRAWSPQEWELVSQLLSSQAGYTAALLAGELHESVDGLMQEKGIHLFPTPREFTASCTCPGTEGLCCHSLSILAALADLIDEDPFLLFELRGLSRTKLLSQVRAIRSGESGKRAADYESAPQVLNAASHKSMLPEQPYAALLKDVGSPAFWANEQSLSRILHPVYDKVSLRAATLLKEQVEQSADGGEA